MVVVCFPLLPRNHGRLGLATEGNRRHGRGNPLLPRHGRLVPSVTTTRSSVSLCYHEGRLFPSVTNMSRFPSDHGHVICFPLLPRPWSSVSLCYHDQVVCFPLLPRPCRLFPSVTTAMSSVSVVTRETDDLVVGT